MINNVILVGRLTKEPELKVTTNNKHCLSFTVACNKRFKSNDNTINADFVNCVVWGTSADYLSQYAHKGDIIGVDGQIQTRNYQDKDGKTVYITEVLCNYVQIVSSKTKEDCKYEPKPIKRNDYDDTPKIGNEYITDEDLPFM